MRNPYRGGRPNQLKPQLLSIINNIPFADNDSASRKQMAAGNHSQILALVKPSKRMIGTGHEEDYGKYTFQIKFPDDCRIIAVIDGITRGVGMSGVKNPETYVIYEKTETGEIDYLVMTKYHSLHKQFGHKYIYDEEVLKTIQPGEYIEKDTVVARPPTVDENGEYSMGREAPILLATWPAVIEDGGWISETLANDLSVDFFEERVFSVGREHLARNLHGDPNIPSEYKWVPDIGGFVPHHGILASTFRYDPDCAPAMMTRDRLRKPDRIHDRRIRAPAGAEIMDIEVLHNADLKVAPTPVGMDEQMAKYDQAKRRFYTRIIDLEKELRASSPDKKLRISRKFHRLVFTALIYNNPYSKDSRKLTYRRVDLDDYRVRVVLRERVRPGMGFKITCFHGGKAVVCMVKADHLMPRDAYGNIIHLVMDPMSLTKRMNNGRVIEPRINSVSMMETMNLRKEYGLKNLEHPYELTVGMVAKRPVEDLDRQFKRLLRYYELASPMMYEWIMEYVSEACFDIPDHIATVLAFGVQLVIPTDSPKEIMDTIDDLDANGFLPIRTKIQFTAPDGTVRWTKQEMLVGSINTALLEKVARDWSAVASAKLQINGVPSKINNSDRYTTPGRASATRLGGETEIRLFLMAIGAKAVQDLLDQSNNPDTHRRLIESVLLAEYPTRIEYAIDRMRFPCGGHRVVEQMNHLYMVGGVKLERREDDLSIA